MKIHCLTYCSYQNGIFRHLNYEPVYCSLTNQDYTFHANSTAFLRSFPYEVVSSFPSCTLQLLSKIVPGGMGGGGRWAPPPPRREIDS